VSIDDPCGVIATLTLLVGLVLALLLSGAACAQAGYQLQPIARFGDTDSARERPLPLT
jgi:hypothetical protein